MWSVVWRLVIAVALLAPALPVHSLRADSPAVPDFSGRWKFNDVKSANLARQSGGSVNAILGGECTIVQTPDTLTQYIVAGALKVEAAYRLDGKPSENQSPGPPGQGPILIVSTTQWMADVLHITTKSESVLNGVKVPVESLRRIWLTTAGDLAVERKGTPALVVSAGWAVYQREAAGPASLTRYNEKRP